MDISYLRQSLYKYPSLKYVFLELTDSCNLKCLHCGSSCPANKENNMLHFEDLKGTIDEITAHTIPRHTMFAITGGEPLLNPEWFDICKYITDKGFNWGMTTNGTLLDDITLNRLLHAGLSTISISIDGNKEHHDNLRGCNGSYDKAIGAIKRCIECEQIKTVQVVTTVYRDNTADLWDMYRVLSELGIDSWKITNIEPIGAARINSRLELKPYQQNELFKTIADLRRNSLFEITYGCAHYLPDDLNQKVRATSFLCGAGLLIASITSKGDIVACLDIDSRDKTKQGNIHIDSFWNVWENRFEMFRNDERIKCILCSECDNKEVCGGDSWHTWDFENNRPGMCLKNKWGRIYDNRGKT